MTIVGWRSPWPALTALALALTATAGAAPASVDVELNLGATPTAISGAPPLVPSGGTVQMPRRAFVVHVDVSLITLTPAGRPKARFELGGGLRWGADDPDPTEGCTSTATTAECQLLSDLLPIAGQSSAGWYWDVVAPANGTYTFSGELFDLAQVDPVVANNSSTIGIVVNEETGGGSAGDGGGGSGSAATVAVGAVKLSPAKPRAGAPVVASVRVTRGGAAVAPSGVACSASIGAMKVKGTPKAARGTASCAFKTPRGAKGKRIAGTVSFRADGRAFSKRFAARLA